MNNFYVKFIRVGLYHVDFDLYYERAPPARAPARARGGYLKHMCISFTSFNSNQSSSLDHLGVWHNTIHDLNPPIVFSISKGKDLVRILGWWRFFYQIFEVFYFFRGLLRKSFIHQKFWNDVNNSLVKYQDNRRRFENVREKMKKTKFWRWK